MNGQKRNEEMNRVVVKKREKEIDRSVVDTHKKSGI